MGGESAVGEGDRLGGRLTVNEIEVCWSERLVALVLAREGGGDGAAVRFMGAVGWVGVPVTSGGG